MTILLAAVISGLVQSPPPAPTGNQVEVNAIGCASGDMLTESNLNHTASAEGLNPTRQWRLRLSSEQRSRLKAIGKKQVEIFGVADRNEIKGATVVKSKQLSKGRVYVGTQASRSPQSEQVRPPTLIVGSISPREEACR